MYIITAENPVPGVRDTLNFVKRNDFFMNVMLLR